MANPINGQIISFLISLIIGFFVGLYYDILKAFRIRLKSVVLSFFLDLIFGLSLAFLFFLMSMTLGKGNPRLLFIIAVLMGSILYYFSLSPVISKLFEKVFSSIAHFLKGISVYMEKLFKKRKKPL